MSEDGDFTMEQYKTCYECKQTKPADQFNKRRNSKDGLDTYCRECGNRRKREYNARNKDKVSAMNRRSYEKNPQQYLDKARSWLDANRNKARLSAYKYRQRNKDLVALWAKVRRARLRQAQILLIQPNFFTRLYSSACVYCGSRDSIEADHVIPLSKGGRHSEGNLVPACKACNRAKHDEFVMEWRIKR